MKKFKGYLDSMKLICLLSFTVLQTFSYASFAQQWQGPYSYNKLPEEKFQGGKERNGDPIYIGIVIHGENVDKKSYVESQKAANHKRFEWFVAKVNPKYRGARYAINGTEYYSKDFLLLNPADSRFSWVQEKDGEIPEGALNILGESKRYICRANWANGQFVGTLIEGEKVCRFGFADRERVVFVYEVLTQ